MGFVASSADGRISVADELPNWTSEEDWEFLQTSLPGFDAVVVGRKTYECARERLEKRNTFVFSRRREVFVREGAVAFINPARMDLPQFLEEYERVAVLGGAEVYQYMLDQRMLDEMFVTVEPVLLGRGREMFSGSTRTTQLELLSVKQLNVQGTLLLHYAVRH